MAAASPRAAEQTYQVGWEWSLWGREGGSGLSLNAASHRRQRSVTVAHSFCPKPSQMPSRGSGGSGRAPGAASQRQRRTLHVELRALLCEHLMAHLVASGQLQVQLVPLDPLPLAGTLLSSSSCVCTQDIASPADQHLTTLTVQALSTLCAQAMDHWALRGYGCGSPDGLQPRPPAVGILGCAWSQLPADPRRATNQSQLGASHGGRE